MNKCGIYGIVNLINGKFLIGSSSHIYARWRCHKWVARNGKHNNYYFQRAWNKYGESMFEFRILEECSVSSLLPREDYWIIFHRSRNKLYGYNLKSACRATLSEETRKKISITKKGQLASVETRKKMSEKRKGEKHWNYGKHHSITTKQKISEANSGKNNAWFGKHHSNEDRRKMSESQKGSKNHNFGKIPSQQHRDKISKANKGHIAWNKGMFGIYYHSKEIRDKMSRAKKGNKNPSYGKHPSMDIRKKMSLAQIKRYQQGPITPHASNHGNLTVDLLRDYDYKLCVEGEK